MEEILSDDELKENTTMQAGWDENGFFLAGERVEPGRYRQVGGGRDVTLERADVLPASLDGRVACYERVQRTWGEMAQLMAQSPLTGEARAAAGAR